MDTMHNCLQIDKQILEIDKTIYDYIAVFEDGSKRGLLSKSILAQLRNFVEHIMLKIYANGSENDRFYIQKIKPFFTESKIYYEVTFTPANEKASKFGRIIAFTN
ncbi:MAG: hypothetical protein LBO62_07520 [Endomicrobium sp.]|jgi:hypothetical protein|nr:hypothetical protein [Endomicrobium sp.]